jgi:RNA polymerase sigma-70 factor (ECF subfamily)
LGQRGQAHIRHTDLRMRRVCSYDQQCAGNLHHRTADRMPALIADLGEQIVELLPRLRRFARTLTGRVQDADDLVHIAIERALSRSDQLRPDSPVSSWLFGILRNAWIDEARARSRRNRVFAPEELGESVADPTGHQHTDVISVQGAMARLPAEQREVVGLVLVEGLSYKEAAEIMNVPVGTVTSRLARGRDALQAMLGEKALS